MKNARLLVYFFIIILIFSFNCSKDQALNPVGPGSDADNYSQNNIVPGIAIDSQKQCHKKSKIYTYEIQIDENASIKFMTWWGRNNHLYLMPVKINWGSYKVFCADCTPEGKKRMWIKHRWWHFYMPKSLGRSASHTDHNAVLYMYNIRPYTESPKTTMTLPVYETGDTTAPTPGNAGIIQVSQLYSTSQLKLDWTYANDNVTAPENLLYRIYYSAGDNLGSVEDIEANGTPLNDYTQYLNSFTVTGLDAGTTYYFNIIVMDEAGNKAVYLTQSGAAFSQSAYTALVNLYNGLIKASTEANVTAVFNSFKIGCQMSPDCEKACSYGKAIVLSEWYLIVKAELQAWTIEKAEELDCAANCQ